MPTILRYHGSSVPDTKMLRDVLDKLGVQLLDTGGLPKIALVEDVDENLLTKLKSQLQDWDIYSENKHAFKVPDTRRKIVRKGL